MAVYQYLSNPLELFFLYQNGGSKTQNQAKNELFSNIFDILVGSDTNKDYCRNWLVNYKLDRCQSAWRLITGWVEYQSCLRAVDVQFENHDGQW